MNLDLAKKAMRLAYADADGCESITRKYRWTSADSIEYSFTFKFEDGESLSLSAKEVEELGMRVNYGHTLVEMRDDYRKLCERLIDEPETLRRIQSLEVEAAKLRADLRETSAARPGSSEAPEREGREDVR